ncbi:anoctamin-7-like isoform X2 [Mustela lutreola]|uniref:anoctamin-7-like isoform X2 n=1 Tax=Mustela lutreola TaxID=9666 RepID=UPI0027970B1A|nr:anoctamin-7-like isoform X2 [Mustela lutreola]
MVRGLWALAPAPLLALLNNNQLESRLFFIYHRFPCESWRPEAEQGNLTLFYWKLLALRLGFIVAFEHVVFVRLLVWLVPDVPAALVTKIKRERCLVVQEPADNREVLPSQGHCPQSPGPGASEAERSFKNPGLS